jgi:aminocarboxymuconate-semialdehyde decarboxylase
MKAADLRVHGLATVPLQDPPSAAAELRHAVLTLGFRGAMIDTNVLLRALGDTALDPFWREAMDLDVPVILHPYVLEEVARFKEFYLHNLVGYPFETTLAACSLIFGGTLDRMPELTVVLVHGGGFFPYQVGRFDHGSRGAGPASRYTRRFYYDTLTHSPQSLCFLCDIVGSDRLLLGSDHPFGLGHPEPVRAVRDAKLGDAAESAALGSNAARLFRLES